MHIRGARMFLAAMEAATIIAASMVASIGYHFAFLELAGPLLVPLGVGVLAAALYGSTIHAIESNQRLRGPASPEALQDVAVVWLGTILVVTFAAFWLKTGEELSRGAIVSFTVLGFVGILAMRRFGPALVAPRLKSALSARDQVIVVGGDDVQALEALVVELNAVGYAAPHLVTFESSCSARDWPLKFAASMRCLMSVAHTAPPGDICISASGLSDERLHDIVNALRVVPRAVRVLPSPTVERLLHQPIQSIGALRSVEMQRAPLSKTARAAKRAIDLVCASFLLFVFAPLFAILAVLIKIDSRGPVFFKQTRLGYRGLPFAILKFRTMTVMEDGPDVKQAQANDIRVTRVGHWLRKFSLDELPQIINVISGEMSLVGPRPHAVAHDKLYSTLIENYEVRQHVKPGITGWAQVHGLRGPTPSTDLMRRRVEHDMWYATHASLWLDIRILLMTVIEVFRQRNAV